LRMWDSSLQTCHACESSGRSWQAARLPVDPGRKIRHYRRVDGAKEV